MSVNDLRAELKLLRSEHPDFMPVSKMKKADISQLLDRLRVQTEITPMMAQEKEKKTKIFKDENIKMPKEKKYGEMTAPEDENPLKEKGIKKHMRDAEGIKKHLKDKEGVKKHLPKEEKKPKDTVKMKAQPVDKEPKKKESIAERMAKLRELKKKK